MGECEFCDILRAKKNVNEFLNERYAIVPSYEKEYEEYTVALVTRRWTKSSGKRNAERSEKYRYRDVGYRLNYCPECGRKL